MAVSKRLRYEILRRDNFQCRYCGATAPDAKITVDHVRPVALGGTDDPSNLVAACDDCNAGKSSATPDHALLDDVRADSELWEQAKAAAAEGRRANKYVGFVDEIADFDEAWTTWTYEDGDRRAHVARNPEWKVSVRVWLLRGLPIARLLELIPIAMQRPGIPIEDRWRYFCGCAWRSIDKFEDEVESVYAAMRDEADSQRRQRDAEVGERVERLVGSESLKVSLERRLGDVGVGELDRVARRALELIVPRVPLDDGYPANSDHVLLTDIRTGVSLCNCEPGEDFALALTRWFLADAGLEAIF